MLFFQFCNIFKFRLFINVDHPFNMGSIQSKSFKRQLLNQQANAAAKIWGYPRDGVYKDCIRFWNFQFWNSKFNFKLEYRPVGWQLCQALGASKHVTGWQAMMLVGFLSLYACLCFFAILFLHSYAFSSSPLHLSSSSYTFIRSVIRNTHCYTGSKESRWQFYRGMCGD